MTEFFLDPEGLAERAATERDAYAGAAPFPHVVLEGLIPDDVLERVLGEFPGAEQDGWWRFDDQRERKLAVHTRTHMGAVTRRLFDELNSATMVDFLGELTGIEGLVPDPHLFGGGMHMILPGGFLEVHADFNLHPLTRLQRRLNLLVYLNHGWSDSYGGALELWDAELRGPPAVVAPVFGRCVVFSTTDKSFHGHPTPLACPPGTARRSLALYYYSAPEPEAAPHNTIFRDEVLDPEPEDVARARAGRGARSVARRLLRR